MEIQNNISLKAFNTFGIDAIAELFAPFQSTEELMELVEQYKKNYSGKNLFTLGGGSNILLTDDVRGLVIKNEVQGIDKVSEDEETVMIKAGAGVNWHNFVMHCLENGYGGVENLALIPGCVGASPMQNIGAYGVEIKDVFHSLEALHFSEGKIVHFNNSDCKFGYRESVFKRKYKNEFVILSVTFKLSKKHILNTTYGAIEQELDKMAIKNPDIRSVAEAVMRIRRSKLPDPAVIGNAGSFFKNPVVPPELFEAIKKKEPGISAYTSGDGYKLAAGWLIEQCGWKGFRKGDAGCHERQALVLVNYGNATGNEIMSLSENIIEDVKNKFGVTLEREVNII